MISKNEQIRYLRQLILPGFGDEAQKKLKNSKVLIVGAGGLGGPVCLYLAAAGVGHMTVCDRDVVELSNLNRQILHSNNDIGTAKSASALKTLSALNPDITIETHHVSIDDSNITKLAEGTNLMVDCLDNIQTRQVLNRYCIRTNTPLLHAGIDNWNAQLTLIVPGETACISCLFGDATDTTEPKPVLGAVAGVVGTMQALEAIKFLIGNSALKNILLYFDAKSLEWTKINIERNPHCKVCGTKH